MNPKFPMKFLHNVQGQFVDCYRFISDLKIWQELAFLNLQGIEFHITDPK